LIDINLKPYHFLIHKWIH